MNPTSAPPSETNCANMLQDVAKHTYLHALLGHFLESQNRQSDTRNMALKKLVCLLIKMHNLDAHAGTVCHTGHSVHTWTHFANMIQPTTDYHALSRCLAHLVDTTDCAKVIEVLLALLAAYHVMVLKDPNTN